MDENDDIPGAELLTAGQLQRWLGLSRSATYDLLQEEIPCYRLGRRTLRVRRRDVEEWLENKKQNELARKENLG